MTSTEIRIYLGALLAFVLTNLHLLRNISPVFPIATLGALGLTTVALLWRGIEVRDGARWIIAALVACMAYACLISFFWFPEEAYADKIPRFLLTLPFMLIGAALCRNHFRTFLFVSAVFGALGGASLIVQSVIGPISWFAESSERGGLVRYASVLGSLTILGTFAGIAMCAAYFLKMSSVAKTAIIFLIAIGCILSLQKAAILNLLLFLLLVAVYEIKNRRYFVIGLGVFLLFLIGIVLGVFFGDYFDVALNSFLRSDPTVVVDDVSVLESIIERTWELPSRLYNDYGVGGILFGVGLVGGSGSLGFPDHPMAHNFVFDMLFIGGVPYLLTYSALVGATILRLYRLRTDKGDVELASLWCMLFFLINLPAATGIQFHPVISSIINLIIGFYFISPLRLKVIAHV